MNEIQPLHLFGETIKAGESKTISMEIAKLTTMNKLKVPIIVERSKLPGPIILFSAGLHGDEINGTETVRQIITKKINKPKRGTIICIPIINIFGFINQTREFPDKRDLNRVFPGSKTGSLASRFAYYIVQEILPNIDYVIDFHAGGAQRFNASQIRIEKENDELKKLAEIFNAPFTLYSKNISGSFRSTCDKQNVKMLLFEGGKSLDLNYEITNEALEGTKRFLQHLDMLSTKHSVKKTKQDSVYIEKSNWIRAKYSGMFHGIAKAGSYVKKGDLLATISDPYGKVEHNVKAPNEGYLINVNHTPFVYQGDAIFHISTQLES